MPILLYLYWALAFSMPILIFFDQLTLGTWVVACVAIGFFSYTGFRAWQRGLETRFIARLAIPVVLFLSSMVLVGVVASKS